MAVADPTLDIERGILAAGTRFIIGCDEVGRGALAGPVAVGLSVIDASAAAVPAGLRDSKLVSEKRRVQLEPVARGWVLHSAVGLATAGEVDEIGIIAALGLAGSRALVELQAAGVDLAAALVLLDGQHDYLTPALTLPPLGRPGDVVPALAVPLPVRPVVKADRDCASVAAASVIAKVHRDRMMIAAHEERPVYGWAENKGYGSAAHLAAIVEHGPCDLHRHTWLKRALAADDDARSA